LREKGISQFLVDHPDRKQFLLQQIERALRKTTGCATPPFGRNANGEPTLVNGNALTKLRNTNGKYTDIAEQVLIKSAETLLNGAYA
jgi:hypothetical protein